MKPKVYVKDQYGDEFLLTSRSLSGQTVEMIGYGTFRATRRVKLADLKAALAPLDRLLIPVTVTTRWRWRKGPWGKKTVRVDQVGAISHQDYRGLSTLAIGCEYFLGIHAKKILKAIKAL